MFQRASQIVAANLLNQFLRLRDESTRLTFLKPVSHECEMAV